MVSELQTWSIRGGSAGAPLVRFARLHSRIKFFRLTESCFLFRLHIALLGQRVFDEIL